MSAFVTLASLFSVLLLELMPVWLQACYRAYPSKCASMHCIIFSSSLHAAEKCFQHLTSVQRSRVHLLQLPIPLSMLMSQSSLCAHTITNSAFVTKRCGTIQTQHDGDMCLESLAAPGGFKGEFFSDPMPVQMFLLRWGVDTLPTL